ncbi:MAG TPA: 4a-hydroxytetrahydrobiopterin dehydratase [Gemmatimonadales bacterium]|nr:4a-hydroxytetrahydrobiopterin dehydratase [Gemmatimonadales bacterium]
MAGRERLSDEQITRELATLPGWRYEPGAGKGPGALARTYKTDGWRATLLLVNAIAYLAEAADHHPDLEAHWGSVVVRISTHSAGGVTPTDFELARQIEDTAQRGIKRHLIEG